MNDQDVASLSVRMASDIIDGLREDLGLDDEKPEKKSGKG